MCSLLLIFISCSEVLEVSSYSTIYGVLYALYNTRSSLSEAPALVMLMFLPQLRRLKGPSLESISELTIMKACGIVFSVPVETQGPRFKKERRKRSCFVNHSHSPSANHI